MKVVQINVCYETSSTGRTTQELHQYLKGIGIESYKFYSIPLDNSEKSDLIGSWLDHKSHAFFSRLIGKQGYFSHIPTLNLIRKLKKIDPDIVILRNLHGNYINLPILTKWLSKKDVATIVVLHDCWFFTGYCCHYTENQCFKWQQSCGNCPLIKKDRASWFFDTTKKVFEDRLKMFQSIPRLAVIGVSNWITDEARKAPVFKNAVKIQRIYNWIDLEKFYPRDNERIRKKLGIGIKEFIVLGVSMSWSYKKGLETFIELAQRFPDIKFILIGKIPDIALPLPSNIISVPPTSSIENLAEYYSCADVLLNLSIQETFGKVAAEALSCGTPLIVNNATANPEIPGDCGIIIENNNVKEIERAIIKIKEEGKGYYKERCIERAQRLFSKNKNLEEYIQIFNQLTDK